VRTLILAAGEATRWNNHLDMPKHMVPIDGEPLIHNMQRRLDNLGVTDVHVITHNPEFVRPPAVQQTPREVDRAWIHRHEGSRHLWHPEDKTLILYGDTYYTDRLLHLMVESECNDWHVYGRSGPSELTGKKYGEIFAWAFRPQHHKTLDAARNVAIAYTENGLWDRCIGWEVYYIATRQLPWSDFPEDVHFVDWDDATEDFDCPEDWDRWKARFPHIAGWTP
jgi:hypothetical protein